MPDNTNIEADWFDVFVKKSHLILFIAGALVAIGMSILYIGSTFIDQQTAKADGAASLGSPVELTRELDPQTAKTSIFAIIAEGFESGDLKATLFDPAGNQIAKSEIKQKKTQYEFEIGSKGIYKLVLENSKSTDVTVVLGLAYVPDSSLVALSYLGFYMIVAGFIGVGVAGIYEFMNRRKSSSGNYQAP